MENTTTISNYSKYLKLKDTVVLKKLLLAMFQSFNKVQATLYNFSLRRRKLSIMLLALIALFVSRTAVGQESTKLKTNQPKRSLYSVKHKPLDQKSNPFFLSEKPELWKSEPFGNRDIIKEATDKRDAVSKHFLNEDGSFTAHIASSPIHYQENGQWKTIYHTISPTSSGFENVFNSHKTFYPATSNGSITTILENGASLKDMLGMQMYYESDGVALQAQSIQNKPGIADYNVLKYHGVYGLGIDLRLTQNTVQRKMDYIIKDATALVNVPAGAEFLVFEEVVQLPLGWLAQLKENVIYLTDDSGNIQALYEKPFLEEATFQNNQARYREKKSADYEITQNGSYLTIKTKVLLSWILASERSFPIVIDPTLNVSPSNTAYWTRSVASDGIAYNTVQPGHDGYAFVRGSVKFNLSSIPAGSRVCNARIFGYMEAGYGNAGARTYQWMNSNDPVAVGAGNNTTRQALYNSMNTAYTASTAVGVWANGWRVFIGFNATGIGAIQSNIGGALSCGVIPTGTWNTDGSQSIVFSNHTSVNRPYIEVDYTPSGCGIAAETAPNFVAASGCTDGTFRMGSGAYYDLAVVANTYYNFSWNNNGATGVSGFCATPQNGTGSSFSANQTGWFSGTTTTLRVSANRSNCWTSTSAIMTYRHTQPTIGTPSNAGPINFCDASGNFTTPSTVTGHANGQVVWTWGSNNGVWNTWLTNPSSGVCCFPKKVSNSDGNADRMRFRIENNGCNSAYSASILAVNRYNEAPTSLASSSTSYCSTAAPANITLTATFPSSINKNGTVAFYSGSCGGTLVGSVTAGDNTATAAVTIAAPASTTTYFVRYLPGTGSGCSNSVCQQVTVTVTPNPGVASNTTSAAAICESGTKALTGSPAGGSWTVVSGGGTISGTTYTPANVTSNTNVTVRYTIPASGACPATTSDVTFVVNVNPGAASNTTSAAAICESGTKALTGSPAGGSWTVVSGGGTIAGTTYTPANVAANTNVTVRYTIPASGACPATTSDVTFVVNVNPGAASNTTSAAAICESGTKALTGSPAGGSWTVVSGGGTIAGTTYTPANVAANTNVTVRYTIPASGACPATTSDVTFVVNVNPGAASNTTSAAAICESGTKALTGSPAGGSWTVVSGGGTIAGTTYTPANVAANTNVTVRYTIPASGACPATTSDVTFVVNVNPGAASNTTSNTGMCGNSSTRALTATPAGGSWSLVSGPGSISGTNYTATGSGNAVIRYTIAANGSCAATTSDVTVTVTAASVAPTGISGAGVTICHGNAVTLTVSGGSLSSGASYEWFTGSCGGLSAGTGNSISVSPSATSTYFVRAGAGTTCPASACSPGALITLPSTAGGLATNGQSATCTVSGNDWIHFYNGGNLIVSINPNGNDLGSVEATAYVSGSPILTQACNTGSNPSFTTAVLGRSWVITPTNNLAASIRFPFSSGELSSLVTASSGTTSNPRDNVAVIGDLKISRYSGVNQDNSWANNCVSAGGSGGTVLAAASGNGTVTAGIDFPATVASSSYIQFATPGFSEFWLHGNTDPSALPVTLTSITATCNNENRVDVSWSTASEQNSQKFVVEKSRDLNQWDFVSELAAAGNSTTEIEYSLTDTDPYGGISYYRLVQTDNDGMEQVYGPISVSCGEQMNSVIVFPNPTKGSFTVEITSAANLNDVEILLTDLTGKLISSRTLDIAEGKNQLLFDGMELQLGTYIVSLGSGNEFKPVKLVVN